MEYKEIEYRLCEGDLLENEVFRAMGYGVALPDSQTAEITRRVMFDAVSVCTMRAMYAVVDAQLLSRRQIRLAGTLFSPGAIITSYLDGMESACIFVATAGVEYNEYIKSRDDILSEFVADSVGSVIAEKAVDKVASCMVAEMGSKGISLPYSPGYCGWNINQQKPFFSLFPDNPCGVILSDSCLMYPEKSVSGFIALGANLIRQPYRCDICTNRGCYKHRSLP